jgi:hypothetical protein
VAPITAVTVVTALRARSGSGCSSRRQRQISVCPGFEHFPCGCEGVLISPTSNLQISPRRGRGAAPQRSLPHHSRPATGCCADDRAEEVWQGLPVRSEADRRGQRKGPGIGYQRRLGAADYAAECGAGVHNTRRSYHGGAHRAERSDWLQYLQRPAANRTRLDPVDTVRCVVQGPGAP